MSAQISSTFVIDVEEALNGSAKTVTNPGRSFRVVQVLVTGLNTAVLTVKKNDNSGATVATTTLATGDLNAFPSTVTYANTVFSATDNIYIVAATAAVSHVSLLCVAADGQSLTVT